MSACRWGRACPMGGSRVRIAGSCTKEEAATQVWGRSQLSFLLVALRLLIQTGGGCVRPQSHMTTSRAELCSKAASLLTLPSRTPWLPLELSTQPPPHRHVSLHGDGGRGKLTGHTFSSWRRVGATGRRCCRGSCPPEERLRKAAAEVSSS